MKKKKNEKRAPVDAFIVNILQCLWYVLFNLFYALALHTCSIWMNNEVLNFCRQQ